jgi:hypothetical protein
VAQQGPPPRRHARPPAPDWADQPSARDEADWPAQQAEWADQQGQGGRDGQQDPQDWTAGPRGQDQGGQEQGGWAAAQPPPSWQEQPAPGNWPAPGTSGAHAAPGSHAASGSHAAPAAPGGWPEQAAPPDWQEQPPQANWPGQPSQPPQGDWPGQAPGAAPGWGERPAEPGWDAPAGNSSAGNPSARHAAQPGWDAPGPNAPAPHPAADAGWGPPSTPPGPGAGWAEPPAHASAAPPAQAPHAAAAPSGVPPAWAEQAPATGAVDLADGEGIAWPEEPGPAPAEAGQAWRNVPVRQPGDLEDPDADELPPWAGLSIMPQRPARQGRTIYPQRGGEAGDAVGEAGDEAVKQPAGRRAGLTRRAIATRSRKARRKLIIGGGTAIVAAFVAAGVWLIVKPSPPVVHAPAFVQTFQPGETQTVPDACQVVTSTVLSQYMPGQPNKVHSASLNGKTSSQCTWTLDAKPVYRVLEVTNEAFSPSGLNPGNGSATNGAIAGYAEAEQQLAHPAKATRLPPAAVSSQPGLGDAAFSAVQVIRRGGTVNDLVTIVIRQRNVLITVALQGEQRAAAGGYGPVKLSELQAGTLAAARQALAALQKSS